MRGRLLCCTLGVLFCVAGCNHPATISPPSVEVVQNANYHAIVAFDLRDDSRPQCGLFLTEQPSAGVTATLHTILLPFPTETALPSRAVFSTWGTIGSCCTLISYIQQSNISGQHAIGLTPAFSVQPNDL